MVAMALTWPVSGFRRDVDASLIPTRPSAADAPPPRAVTIVPGLPRQPILSFVYGLLSIPLRALGSPLGGVGGRDFRSAPAGRSATASRSGSPRENPG